MTNAKESPPQRKDYSVPAVARIFNCSPGTVANWITAGKVKAYRLGGAGHWRVPWPEVERLRSEWTYSPVSAESL